MDWLFQCLKAAWETMGQPQTASLFLIVLLGYSIGLKDGQKRIEKALKGYHRNSAHKETRPSLCHERLEITQPIPKAGEGSAEGEPPLS